MKIHHVRDEHDEGLKNLGLGYEGCRLGLFLIVD